jgi:hypothetical protein
MGSTKLWLPSRRSVASHRGALSMVLFGHWRSGRLMGGNLLYFLEGSLSLEDEVVSLLVRFDRSCSGSTLTWAFWTMAK